MDGWPRVHGGNGAPASAGRLVRSVLGSVAEAAVLSNDFFRRLQERFDGLSVLNLDLGKQPTVNCIEFGEFSRPILQIDETSWMLADNREINLFSAPYCGDSRSTMPTRPKLSGAYNDPHVYPPGVAFVDGQYLHIRDAKVSILDWGFLRSDATYDVVHVWDGRFFRLDRHLERFFLNMDQLRLVSPHPREEVAEILHNCVALSELQRAYVQVLCTRGTSPDFSRDPRQAKNRLMAFAVPFGSIAGPEQMKKGLHATVSDRVRIPPNSFDPRIKNYQWLDLVCGLFEAYDNDRDIPLLRDAEGNLTEGPGFNLFIVNDRTVSTPEHGVLEGITRQTALELCHLENLDAETRPVSVKNLLEADEVFVTSTAGGIMPVCRIDGRRVGDGTPGSVTMLLHKAYWDRHTWEEWTEAVDYSAV